MAIVYRHIRLDKNEPFYIGIGTSERRAFCKSDRNSYWKSIAKNGYKVEILFDDLTWGQACEKEKEFIKLYGRKDLGTGCLVNKTDGGDGLNNISDETRNLMKLVQLGKKHNDNTKEKMRLAHTGEKNHFYGKTHNQNSIDKIRDKQIGKIASEDTKQKMSESQKKRHSKNTKYNDDFLSTILNELKISRKKVDVMRKYNIPRSSFHKLIKKIKQI